MGDLTDKIIQTRAEQGAVSPAPVASGSDEKKEGTIAKRKVEQVACELQVLYGLVGSDHF